VEGEYQKRVIDLVARCNLSGRLSTRRREKFCRLESKISRLVSPRRSSRELVLNHCSCGEDIENLERFVDAQRTAFRKILKKYKVGTGS
jgi:hypothetical protein